MTEASAPASSAGRLLRDAREAQGLRLAALAHTIKVPPQKLEALEADRYDELPDVTFVRGLAQAVCRSLQIDAAPVLALLPRASGHRLEQLGEGLNTPFRERPGRFEEPEGSWLGRPAVWGPALLLLAATLVYFMPSGLLSRWHEQASAVASGSSAGTTESVVAIAPSTGGDPTPAETPAATPQAAPPATGSAAEPALAAEAPEVATAPAATTEPPAAAAPAASGALAAASAAAAGSLLQVRAARTSWIEVVDGNGRALLSRLVQPGETVALDGAVPLKIRIGNAADTTLVFRGQPLALAPYTRNNLARLELK